MWDKQVSGGGSTVTQSITNGNIKVNDTEISVYDDSAVRALIGGDSSKISGKKIACMGHSMTASTNGATAYPTFLQNDYGCTTLNYGIGGSTMQHTETVYASVIDRYASMDSTADIVVLWGCFYNDLTLGAPLGVFSDRVNNTFYGSLHLILSGLKTKYLGKPIFITTEIDTNHAWDTVKMWNQAIREVAEYWAVTVIESATFGINARNADIKAAYFSDTIHPNTAGNKKIADTVAAAINSH